MQKIIKLTVRVLIGKVRIYMLKRKEPKSLDDQYDALMKRVDRYNARQRMFPHVTRVILVLWIVVILWLISQPL